MSTIFKVSDQESITPAFESVERELVASAGNPLPASLDDAALVGEMERIERCAATGENYAFNPEWNPEHVAQLREYAVVCGMRGKMLPNSRQPDPPPVADDPDTRRLAEAVSAAKPVVSADLAIAVGDPFHLSDLSDAPAKKENWEVVAPGRRLASQPSAMAGGITPIRGEYEYSASPSLRVRRGENSVADPDAIGKLAGEQDTGERLKAENARHMAERKAAKTAWQKEAVQAAKDMVAGALPRGKVFMTGSLPEKPRQSGLDLKQVVSELSQINRPFADAADVPDLTDGEKLHAANAARKTGIQRVAAKDDWQKVKGSTRPSLTDEFADALERQLSAAGIPARN